MTELVDIKNIVARLALDGWVDPDELEIKAEMFILEELRKRATRSSLTVLNDEFNSLIKKVVELALKKHGSVNKRKEGNDRIRKS